MQKLSRMQKCSSKVRLQKTASPIFFVAVDVSKLLLDDTHFKFNMQNMLNKFLLMFIIKLCSIKYKCSSAKQYSR